ncbi:MAG: hypothetical protein P8Y73_04530 [Desulfuromonadales bacterium]|jgi:hypothetical protein
MVNKIVVHYANGTIVKGETGDFFPNKTSFHIKNADSNETQQINVSDLKAIYFVKSLVGDSSFKEKKDVDRTGFGRKIQVHFKDGEIQHGYTQGYSPNRPGFFVSPCDPDSNNERIFIVTGATQNVQFI